MAPPHVSQARLSKGAGGGLPQGPALSPALQRPRLEPSSIPPTATGPLKRCPRLCISKAIVLRYIYLKANLGYMPCKVLSMQTSC